MDTPQGPSPIDGATSSTYIVSSARAAAAGYYKVGITNANTPDVPYSDVVQVTVNPAADTSAPTTTATLVGTTGQNGWNVGPVTLTLAATDPDGSADVASTSYRVNDGSWTPYATPLGFGGSGRTYPDGTYTVQYRSVDQAGNTEDPKSLTVKADTAPATSATAQTADGGSYRFTNGTGPWARQDITLSLAATDATSGVAVTSYSIDGGGPQPYTGPVTLSREGTHTLTRLGRLRCGLDDQRVRERRALDGAQRVGGHPLCPGHAEPAGSDRDGRDLPPDGFSD